MNPIIKYIQEKAGNETKHNQIVDGIIQAISEKAVKKGDVLPSVNMFIEKLSFLSKSVARAKRTRYH